MHFKFTEATWEYLSKERWSNPADLVGDTAMPIPDDFNLKKQWASSPVQVLANDRIAEVQLHQIKTGLGLIEELWRDFSMGSNHVAQSQFLSGHKCVKEIGKELYSNIFSTSHILY